MKYRIFAALIILFGTFKTTKAQEFTSSAKLSVPKINGFHSILITPKVRSFSQLYLEDVRLFDSQNNEVPYYIWNNSRYNTSYNFVAYPIVSSKILANKESNIIIENTEDKSVEEFVLNINNTKLIKKCNISGSNNQKDWFGILQKYNIANAENSDTTNSFLSIKIPKSGYRFYRFQINDLKTAPIDILKIGYFNKSTVLDKLIDVKPLSVNYKTNKALKKTTVSVVFKEMQLLENIEFVISKPNYYKRTARLLVRKERIERGKEKGTYLEPLVEFEINSERRNSFDINKVFEKEFFIEIENEDNPALEFSSLKFSQYPTFIVPDLKSGENYTLKTGNGNLLAPNYDIVDFKQNSISTFPEISVLAIESTSDISSNPNPNPSFWQNKWFLWVCIAVGALAVLFFSYSLIKEMK